REIPATAVSSAPAESHGPYSSLAHRLDTIERRLASLERQMQGERGVIPAEALIPAEVIQAEAVIPVAPPPTPEPERTPEPPRMPAPPPPPSEPNAIVAWLFGGNTIVRVGIVVLFFGLAFLVKYGVEHQMIPVELRVAAVGAAGLALLVIG